MRTTMIMRNATPLKPLERRKRPESVIQKWQQTRREWMASLEPAGHFHLLFDHIPGVYFFAKDRAGCLMFASAGLRQRYSMTDETEILGMTDFDLNPGSMAQSYVDDDQQLLSGEVAIVERLELWWDRQGMPDWFVVTKLPLRDQQHQLQGVMGVLRRPDEAERQLPVFQAVAKAVDLIRRSYAKPVALSEVATACGQSLRQLQRRFQSAFGITPQEFLIKTRVLAAIRLLEESSLTAAEIAECCGFVDASAFTEQFRKRTGLTPTAYRRKPGLR